LDEEEWEIVRIIGKRRRGKGYKYKVCWKKTWLLEHELGNAQELLREFEARRSGEANGEDRHVQTRVGDLWLFCSQWRYTCSSFYPR